LIVSFEGDSLEAIVGAMHAFLAQLERGRAAAPNAAAAGTYTGPALPPCPRHLCEMAYRPAGTNRRGRRYSASYRCPRPDCREAVWLD
jgi:hypothetical protein